MKILVTSLFCVISSLGYAQTAPTIYGQWALPAIQGNGIVIKMHLLFQSGQVTEIAECSGYGSSAVSKVSAPVDITQDTVTIKAAAQHTEFANGFQCNASLSVGSVNYLISQNNQMLQLVANGSTLNLTREN